MNIHLDQSDASLAAELQVDSYIRDHLEEMTKEAIYAVEGDLVEPARRYVGNDDLNRKKAYPDYILRYAHGVGRFLATRGCDGAARDGVRFSREAHRLAAFFGS